MLFIVITYMKCHQKPMGYSLAGRGSNRDFKSQSLVGKDLSPFSFSLFIPGSKVGSFAAFCLYNVLCCCTSENCRPINNGLKHPKL